MFVGVASRDSSNDLDLILISRTKTKQSMCQQAAEQVVVLVYRDVAVEGVEHVLETEIDQALMLVIRVDAIGASNN